MAKKSTIFPTTNEVENHPTKTINKKITMNPTPGIFSTFPSASTL